MVNERKIKAVTQMHPMGCAVACVAFCTNTSYNRAFKRFKNKSHAWGRGYFCPEIVKALSSFNQPYHWIKKVVRSPKLLPERTIVFCAPNKFYPHGHFLVKSSKGRWMNPWINHPQMTPAKSGFVKRLPGKISYIIIPVTSPTL